MRQLQGPEPRFGPSSQKLGLGLGPGLTENLGGLGLGWGVQGPGAGPKPRLDPKLAVFRRSEKSPGRGLAKGWESAETAAADVGAWREAGTGYPPYPPPPLPPPPAAFLGCREKKRVFTLSVTETIQHAPQGRRIYRYPYITPVDTL